MVQRQRASSDGEDVGELQPSSLLISAVSTTASEVKSSMPIFAAWKIGMSQLESYDL